MYIVATVSPLYCALSITTHKSTYDLKTFSCYTRCKLKKYIYDVQTDGRTAIIQGTKHWTLAVKFTTADCFKQRNVPGHFSMWFKHIIPAVLLMNRDK